MTDVMRPEAGERRRRSGSTRVPPHPSHVVRAGRLELRWTDDELILELARLASRGIHDATHMPFRVPWTRGSPDQVIRHVLTHQWSARTAVAPDAFQLEYAALVDGVVVGSQGARAKGWSSSRTATTGAWLGREFQGQGIGTRMRMLMLHLLFEGLEAQAVTSSAFADNAASNAVSAKLGYYQEDSVQMERENATVTLNRFRMTRERWLEVRPSHIAQLDADVHLEGVAALRREIG